VTPEQEMESRAMGYSLDDDEDGSEMSTDEFERLLARAWLAEQRKKVKEALERALGKPSFANRWTRNAE
jgi:hypothetical protein